MTRPFTAEVAGEVTDALMVLPRPPYVFARGEAVDAVSNTPKWDSVDFSNRQVMRPQEGLIVIAYRARASKGDEAYEAHCTTTLRRLAHGEWQVVQHQQTPPLTSGGAAEEAN